MATKKSSGAVRKADIPTMKVKSHDEDGKVYAVHTVPRELGDLADHAFALDEKRLRLNREAKAVEVEVSAIKKWIEEKKKKSGLTGFQGSTGALKLVPKTVPRVTDWDAFYKYMSRTKSFELIQRRVNEAAVRERWEARKEVPGVGTWDYTRLSVTRAK